MTYKLKRNHTRNHLMKFRFNKFVKELACHSCILINLMFECLELMLKARNQLSPTGLYNQCVSLQNDKLFFIGMQDQFYTFTMFQLQVCLPFMLISVFQKLEASF